MCLKLTQPLQSVLTLFSFFISDSEAEKRETLPQLDLWSEGQTGFIGRNQLRNRLWSKVGTLSGIMCVGNEGVRCINYETTVLVERITLLFRHKTHNAFERKVVRP